MTAMCNPSNADNLTEAQRVAQVAVDRVDEARFARTGRHLSGSDELMMRSLATGAARRSLQTMSYVGAWHVEVDSQRRVSVLAGPTPERPAEPTRPPPCPVRETASRQGRDDLKFKIMQANLVERFGEQHGRFLAKRLARMIRRCKDTACLSHLRVAKVGDDKACRKYDAIRSSGCCGFADEEFTFWTYKAGCVPWPEVYRVGFNFGH